MDSRTKSPTSFNKGERVIEEIIIWSLVTLGLVALVLGLIV